MIVTPTDMRSFVGSHDMVMSHLISLPPEVEPTIRHAIDAVFQELPYIGDEPDLVSCYLEGITEPLEALRNSGIGIFAINTRGTIKMADGSSMPN